MSSPKYARLSAIELNNAIYLAKQQFFIGAAATARHALDLAMADLLQSDGIGIGKNGLDSRSLMDRCVRRNLLSSEQVKRIKRNWLGLGCILHGKFAKPEKKCYPIVIGARALARAINPRVAAAIQELDAQESLT